MTRSIVGEISTKFGPIRICADDKLATDQFILQVQKETDAAFKQMEEEMSKRMFIGFDPSGGPDYYVVEKFHIPAKEKQMAFERQTLGVPTKPERFGYYHIDDALRIFAFAYVVPRDGALSAEDTAERMNKLPINPCSDPDEPEPIWDRRYQWVSLHGCDTTHVVVDMQGARKIGERPSVIAARPIPIPRRFTSFADGINRQLQLQSYGRRAFHALGMIGHAFGVFTHARILDMCREMQQRLSECDASHPERMISRTAGEYERKYMKQTGWIPRDFELNFKLMRQAALRDRVRASDEKRRIKVYCQGEED